MPDVGSISQPGPLAYFLTWTTYGSWLPGDARGWVDGRGGMHLPEPSREAVARRCMKDQPVLLAVPQRGAVERAIVAHCGVRGWHLHAVQCRTSHVHVVVTAMAVSPEEVLRQLKAWCTRALRRMAGESNADSPRRRWWTEGGSRRQVLREGDLTSVIAYVAECQGLPTRRPPSA
jgi:REP element-mobilizing transposase RayT